MLDVGGISPAEFALFQKMVYSHAGIMLKDIKKTLVVTRLHKRVAALGLQSFKSYYDYVTKPEHSDEFDVCINALTTNETYFFRHREHWDFLSQFFLPEWLSKSDHGPVLRLWSAAASTGEEAYSAAILLDSMLSGKSGVKIAIDATDINDKVLARAAKGKYSDYSLQKVTETCLRRYFQYDKEAKLYGVTDDIRRMVNFRKHNLLEKSRGSSYDLVFLRNVLIYFDHASSAKVVENVMDRIRPGGYLVLGGAENMPAGCRGILDYVKPSIFRKRGNE